MLATPSWGARKARHPEIAIDRFLQARGAGRFVGRAITLRFREAELQDAFRLIAQASGFNIVIDEGVTGRLTIELEDVPWDQALDVIMKAKHLRGERSNGVLLIRKAD